VDLSWYVAPFAGVVIEIDGALAACAGALSQALWASKITTTGTGLRGKRLMATP
jgi:hypothetical protein